jgi:hypothetical protein
VMEDQRLSSTLERCLYFVWEGKSICSDVIKSHERIWSFIHLFKLFGFIGSFWLIVSSISYRYIDQSNEIQILELVL